MIAMNSDNPLFILIQEMKHLITYNKQHIESWSLMVLPFKGERIRQLRLIDLPTTDIDNQIRASMVFIKKFSNVIDRVTI